MREHVCPANLVTSVSLVVGFLALLLVPVWPGAALVLVLTAAVLDGVDGALARRSGKDHTFGAQLDSLADLLCFCVVPAFALYQLAPVPLAAAAGSGVVLAGSWRLSRFPLVREHGHFVGLPTPAAGCLVLPLALWAPPALALIGAVALSALMVSSVRFPTVPVVVARVRRSRRIGPGPQRRRRPRVPRVLRPLRRSRQVHRGRSGRRSSVRQRAAGRAGQVLGSLRRDGDHRRARP